MWSAYQNLCDIEDKTIDVDTLFTRPQNLDYCLDVSSLAPEYPKANPEMDVRLLNFYWRIKVLGFCVFYIAQKIQSLG